LSYLANTQTDKQTLAKTYLLGGGNNWVKNYQNLLIFFLITITNVEDVFGTECTSHTVIQIQGGPKNGTIFYTL